MNISGLCKEVPTRTQVENGIGQEGCEWISSGVKLELLKIKRIKEEEEGKMRLRSSRKLKVHTFMHLNVALFVNLTLTSAHYFFS